MKRLTLATVFLALAACDVSQELQGAGLADGGTTNPPGTDASATNPPGTDGGLPGIDGGPTTDSGTDGATTRQLSICTPQTAIGSTALVVKGNESAYFRDVGDIASGAGRVFALSGPWTFVGVPLAGGAAESFDVTATLPTFVAVGIAAARTNPFGSLTTPALASYNLPSGDGQILALRGSRSTTSEISGRILVDGDDVFYFHTQAPSRLVHSGTVSHPTEQLLAEYPTASGRVVTAAKLVGTYVYFATAVTTGGSASAVMFHRVPRAGGAIEDLVTTGLFGQIEGIHEDGGSLYLTPGGEQGSVSTFISVYAIATGALGTGNLQGNGDTVAYARSSGVAFDGSSFYYGSSTGGGACAGKLVRISKDVAINRIPGKADILATNLDRVVRVRSYGANVYAGTSGDPFFKPVGYPGQMLRWAP